MLPPRETHIMTLVLLVLNKLLSSFLGSDLLVSLVSLVLVLVLLRVAQSYWYIRKLPPGPWGVPLLGYLPFLSGAAHQQFTELSKKFGSTFSLRLGSQLIVVLSDYKSIRKAFRREAFSGRPVNDISAIIEGYGVVNVDGKLWKEQRKFLHDRLRQFGMKTNGSGKEQLETRIMTEVGGFLQNIALANGKPTSLTNSMVLSFSNVICSLLMSVRFSEDDPRYKRFTGLIEEGFQLCTATGASNFIPCLKNLPRLQALNLKIQANREEMTAFFRDIVEMHKQTFDPSDVRDVVDTYLLEIDIAKDEGRDMELYHGKDPDRQIYQVMGDMYSAGMETVKTAMNWAVLYMLHHPEVMKNVQNELDEVVGRHRLPSLEDLNLLPYTEATLLEVFRRSCIVPLGTTHSTITDVILDGYLIPKNAQVIPNLYAVHMDPELWDEPESFDPSRFINDAGEVEKPEYFMPFGVGRRMCLGDVLARHQLFLFFSSLLHTYDLEPVEGSILPDLIGFSAVSTIPDKYKLCAKLRNTELLDKLERLETVLPTSVSPEPPVDKRNVGQH